MILEVYWMNIKYKSWHIIHMINKLLPHAFTVRRMDANISELQFQKQLLMKTVHQLKVMYSKW
jgi:hypothetical protein